MASSDSDSDSRWNNELIAALSEEQKKTKMISEENRIDRIQECLDEDAEIDTVDENGNTALHTAIKKGYRTVAEFVRSAGARTNIPNHERETAISLARDLGEQEIACILNQPSTSRNSDQTGNNPSLDPFLNSQIRKHTAAAQDRISDGSLSKLRLIDAPQADPWSDVTSDEQRSNRKRTADDELVEHTKRLRKMTLTARKEKYEPSLGLKNTLHGTVYQLKHLMLIMHRARKSNYSFQLATEMKTAAKFDDVVLRYKDSNGDVRYRFLQVKHKQDGDKAISAKDLSNILDGDFSLLKYFVSWRKIKRNPIFGGIKSKDFILCTNIGIKVDDLEKRNITVVQETENDDLLNQSNMGNEKRQPRRYKLLIENSSRMWKTLKYRSGGKVTDDEISRFLDEFILAVNQPNEIELGEIIERDIGEDFNRLDVGIVKDSFQIEILDWFKTKDGKFLTDVDANEFFNKMQGKLDAIKTMAVGLDHMQKLEELGIRFNDVNTILQNIINSPNDGSKQLLEIISQKQTLLTALQVCQTLAQKQKLYKNEIFTFVRLKTLSRQKISQLVLRAFEWSADQNLLIVDCESISAKQHLQSLWNPICDIMEKDVNKKMILITQSGKDLGSECYLDREICRVDNTGYSFKNLTNESRKKLLGKRVTKFQGTDNNTNLAELLDIPDWDNLRGDELNDLSNIMDTESLIELISDEELQIGRELDGLEDVGEYYVNRTIFRHVVIKEDILKDTEIPDLLAISGIDGILSGESMWIEETSHSSESSIVSSVERYMPDELLRIDGPSSAAQCRTSFITLERNQEEKQFNTLCAENEDRNVHWLKKEQGKYIWERSQGNITYLVQHRDDRERKGINERTGVTHLNEDKLAAHSEPVIISDTAGMGKSTMLTYLALKIKENEPDMLVLQINLSHHSTALAEVKKKSSYDLGSIDGTIQFLVKKLLDGETNFSRKVFNRIIERNHKVALIFDAFDEISPTYEKTVIDMLRTLADCGTGKLFVATRPHTRGSLEAKLNAFSFEIRPFSTYDQGRFLTSFWKTKFEDSHHDLNPTAEDRIRKYTVAIMKTLADSIKDQRNKFTAIPLQAKLVAEIFEHHNEEVRGNFDSCKDFIDSEADEPKFPEKINLIYLYEHFVKKKFEIFFEKRGGNLADVAVLEDKRLRYESYMAKHEKLALKTLFDWDKIEELLLFQPDSCYGSPESTDLEIPIERDGIITQFIDGQPQFGHRTYAEYFAAKFFSKILKKRETDESFGKIFVAHVLMEDKYQTMRAFMNWLLSDEADNILEGEFWTHFVKEHRSQNEETIFHLAAAEGNDRIIQIFLNCFGINQEDRKVIIHVGDFAGRTAVHRAVKYGYLDKIKLLAEDIDFEINCQDAVGFTPLHQAAQMGTLDVVRYFIDKGADVNSRTNDGSTPLKVAAGKGELGIVSYLIEKGADVNLATNDGETPLFTAAGFGQLEMVKYLHEKGANINSQAKDGRTPLHRAAFHGRLDIVNYLLDKKADLYFLSNYGRMPMYWAIIEGQLDVVKCFLEKGADVNLAMNDGETPLYTAARFGRFGIVKYLLHEGANINCRTHDGETPLHVAARKGELSIVDYFLEQGADINLAMNDGETPLYTAACSGQLEIVKYLLHKEANIDCRNHNGETPLHVAARKGELSIVDCFLEKGADVNLAMNDGETPLYTATRFGQFGIVKYLLHKGANINCRTHNGETPLHVAVREGELGIVDCLLEKKAVVDSPTNDGETPLYTAAWSGQSEMVKYLLEKGATSSFQTDYGLTPLHVAVAVGELGIVDSFLETKADINLPTNEGETPLYTAARFGRFEMVKYLLEKGADINSRTIYGLTPLHVAAREGELSIVDCFLEMGAYVNLPTNDGATPLYTAAWFNQLEMVKYLLEKGADINSRTMYGETLLYTAASFGELEMVKYSLKNGANINSRTDDGSTPLEAAARKGDLGIVDYLLEEGADVNLATNYGETPLYAAAWFGQLKMVNYLLEKGADINSRTNDGSTLLHAAAYGGELGIADCFLDRGADVDSPTNDGKTPESKF